MKGSGFRRNRRPWKPTASRFIRPVRRFFFGPTTVGAGVTADLEIEMTLTGTTIVSSDLEMELTLSVVEQSLTSASLVMELTLGSKVGVTSIYGSSKDHVSAIGASTQEHVV